MISNETELTYSDVFVTAPGTILGYRANGNAIYTVAGGSIDVSDDDTVDDGDDSGADTSDDGTHEEDKWTPPSQADYEKLVADKRKSDSEAAARKRFLRDAGFDPKTGQQIVKPTVNLSDEDDDDSTTDTSTQAAKPGFDREKLEKQAQRVLERETAKAETRGRSTAYSLISEVPSALEEAGWNGKNLPRMIKLLDLDSVEIDADGVDADALTSQVAELKKDFPEFFKRSRMRDAAKEVADAETVGGGNKKAPASAEEQDWKARLRQQLAGGA